MQNPWDTSLKSNGLEQLAKEDTVLLIGTGLTMVDLVMTLWAKKHNGKIHAVSRHGLLPQAHGLYADRNPFLEAKSLPKTALGLFKLVREEVRTSQSMGGDWRAVIDSMRPMTQQLWHTLDDAEKHKFLRHLRPFWEARRHRMPAESAERIQEMIAANQLVLHKARVHSFKKGRNGIFVNLKRPGQAELDCLNVKTVINCTGPNTDYASSSDPLIRSLIENGLAKTDTLCLGLDVDSDGMLRTDDSLRQGIFTLGPARKGLDWETIAVPEIRGQAKNLAKLILAKI